MEREWHELDTDRICDALHEVAMNHDAYNELIEAARIYHEAHPEADEAEVIDAALR